MTTHFMLRTAFVVMFLAGILSSCAPKSQPTQISVEQQKDAIADSNELPMPREIDADQLRAIQEAEAAANASTAETIPIEPREWLAPEVLAVAPREVEMELLLAMPREREQVAMPRRELEILEIQPRRALLLDFDLAEPDLGLDPTLPLNFKIERVEDLRVPSAVEPKDIIGVPDIATLPLIPSATEGIGNIGGGMIGTGGFRHIQHFEGRRGEAKEELLKRNGGTDDTEAAVWRSLAWIAKQQKADGSWEFDGSAKADKAAATAMAILTFLGAGETHMKGNKFKDAVAKGLLFLGKEQAANGQIGKGTMYSQAFCALAICEAYGLSLDAKLKRPAQMAIDYIIKAQADNGSWGYSPKQQGDTSITGWQIQALKTAAAANLFVPKLCFTKADQFLESMSSEQGSQFGYRAKGSPTPTLSAVGLYSRLLINLDPKSPALAKGVTTIWEKSKPDKSNFNVYQLYYATNLIHQFGGPAWQRDWNPALRDMLLKLQTTKATPNVKDSEIGSYPGDSAFIGSNCGKLGTTCMSTLCLEVYYRHLNLFKRDAEMKKMPDTLP